VIPFFINFSKNEIQIFIEMLKGFHTVILKNEQYNFATDTLTPENYRIGRQMERETKQRRKNRKRELKKKKK
jgi:hypothetical protein